MPCPVPDCQNDVPKRSVFCVDHYFLLPRGYTKLVFATKFACERAEDDGERQHLRDQLASYVASCVRTIEEQNQRKAS
jgi:hypothetical protein